MKKKSIFRKLTKKEIEERNKKLEEIKKMGDGCIYMPDHPCYGSYCFNYWQDCWANGYR